MQNRQFFLEWWEHFRQQNGIALRLLALIPEDKLDARPIGNMRTPKELLVHMYGTIVRNCALGITTGTIDEFNEVEKLKTLNTKDALLAFVRACWATADTAAKTVTDAQLLAQVKTPWGFDMPGWKAGSVINDEYLHHRGQLYAYARALGIEPPMVWDFEHNEAPFAPAVTAKA